ncbi:alpha/beta hydrolase [candidate division KSB1 bacterium]|nr:alpha/beta hydrolase [candidate division KSB1 bacterium]
MCVFDTFFYPRNNFSDSSGICTTLCPEIECNRQRIVVHGSRIGNPILLWVDTPFPFLKPLYSLYPRPLEKRFVMARWMPKIASNHSLDFGEDGKPLDVSASRLVISISRYLLDLLQRDRLLVVGQSWGSVWVLNAAQKSPDLFSGSLGLSPRIDARESDRLLYLDLCAAVRKNLQTKLLAQLTQMGPPPYHTQKEIHFFFRQLAKTDTNECATDLDDMRTTRFCKIDEIAKRKRNALQNFISGYQTSIECDSSLFQRDFKVPIWFVAGRYDPFSRPTGVEKFFSGLLAKDKKLLWFEQSRHAPWHDEPKKFIRIVTELAEATR